jgi:hypothetical protein
MLSGDKQYAPAPEPKPAPKVRPPPGKPGKRKTRSYSTPTITSIEKLYDRRGRSKGYGR